MVIPRRVTTRIALALVGLAAVVVVLPGLGNGFAYDDVPVIVDNAALHSLDSLPRRLTQPYWPTGLFRPVSLAAFAAEWMAGGGSPLPFRVVSTVLSLAVSVGAALLALALGAGAGAALIGGLAFALHPVHSEVTANIVGQAELLSALFAMAAVGWYIWARRRPSLAWGDAFIVTLLTVLSAHAKESGFTVVGLLVAVELLVVADRRSGAERWKILRGLALLMTAAVLGSLALRTSVLGSMGGEVPHRTLEGLAFWERGVAMLAIVPEWTRLLLWPAHLQAEYGPPQVVPQITLGSSHLIGVLIFAVVVMGLTWSWRRAPLVALGLAWIAIALAPVTNLVFPTGILLAERTLFLPSAGFALMLAGLVDLAGPRLASRSRILATAAIAVILVLAGLRSAARQPAWRDTLTILRQTTVDAPRSYRAHHLLGKELLHRGDRAGARRAFAQAGALWDRDPRPFEELGQLLRADGNCADAVPVLQRGVLADSSSNTARSRLVECLIIERRWDEAEREIARGLAQGVTSYRNPAARIREARKTEAPAVP